MGYNCINFPVKTSPCNADAFVACRVVRMQSQPLNFIMTTHNSGMAHTTNMLWKQLFSSEILTVKKNVCIY